MATSDLTDSPTAPSAGATTTALASRIPSGLVVPPPGQVRPVHDDLATEPAGASALAPPAQQVVSELVVSELVVAEPVVAEPVAEELVAEPVQEPAFERPVVGGEDPAGVSTEDDEGRGTPRQALAGWGGALVLGAACWAGALSVVSRVL